MLTQITIEAQLKEASQLTNSTWAALVEREAQSLPERGDRVLVGVVAAVALAQYERGAVGTGELPRRGADHGGDLVERFGERQALNHRE